MARRQEVYTAKAKRTVKAEAPEDGAVSAKYKKAKDKGGKTAAGRTAEKEVTKKSAEKKTAARSDSRTKAASPGRRTAVPKAVRVLPAQEKRKAVRRTAAARCAEPDEDKDERRLAAMHRRIQRKEKKEATVFRDRKRAVSRAGDARVTLIALLTLLFEVLGLLLAAVRTEGTVDMQAVMLCAVVAPVGLITSLLLPRVLPIDSLIMALTNFLCGVGLVILYTVAPERGVRQAQFYVAGLVLMIVIGVMVSRMRRFRGITLLAMVLGIMALVLPLAFGEWNNGAKNWVELPVVGSFQPSELVKLSLVLALAYYFSAHRTVFQMMPAILFAAACLVLLMLQRDLGTALIYYLTTLVLFYAACGNVPLTMLGLCGGAGAAVLGYNMFAHVKVRVAMWRNPWSDPLDKGYQIIQALLAIGSGGLFGVGLGQGTPEKIPAYYNDFIFAVICEQMGLVFGLLLLLVYVLLILRGVTVISRSRRSFDMLLGCGVLAMIGIQTFMIVAGVIKMIPLTGVTMPFLSYGGSSLMSCMAMVGILHGISGRAQENLEEDVLTSRV